MPYGLRHSVAAVGIRAGMDIASLALMMGHASRAMTLDTYGDANADALNLASVKLKDTFNDNTDYFKLEEEQEQNGQDYFNGTILEIQDSFVLVECLEVTSGAVSVGTEAQVSLDVTDARGVPEMAVGDNIRVVFTGVQEKDPVGFDTVFAIYLLDENGEVIFPE